MTLRIYDAFPHRCILADDRVDTATLSRNGTRLLIPIVGTGHTLYRVAEAHGRVAGVWLVRLNGGEIRMSECLALSESDLA